MEVSKRRRGRDKGSKSTVWPEYMSPEARIAMEQAIEDTKAMKREAEERLRREMESQLTERQESTVETPQERDALQEDVLSNDENVERRLGSAPSGDDDDEDKVDETGGREEEGINETSCVTTVDAETIDPDVLDEKAIEEMARINSVDKCTDWNESTDAAQEGKEKADQKTAETTPNSKESPADVS